MVIANHSLASFFQNRLQSLPFLAILVLLGTRNYLGYQIDAILQTSTSDSKCIALTLT